MVHSGSSHPAPLRGSGVDLEFIFFIFFSFQFSLKMSSDSELMLPSFVYLSLGLCRRNQSCLILCKVDVCWAGGDQMMGHGLSGREPVKETEASASSPMQMSLKNNIIIP